eukprot:CAMPEP_0194564490 /NCGR_PEP_ID=MMETSP0292-20121207/4122_1 /TAXON_ID=39354 /ORGANISM="Heterosigma akashiwo, Strain CCMP2393" /LENGTH=34 /DNA_ID= /DNA_START= /DNA_END= /DNA_ORIENTATION=
MSVATNPGVQQFTARCGHARAWHRVSAFRQALLK